MMRLPIATYRIQFNIDFGFPAAQSIIPYLKSLGISDLYASPILTAAAGSTHGYDVVNPNELNPELGGREKFEELAETIKEHKLGWLQDIVPNHMAFDSQNPMLVDVLENGPDSQYRDFFDINWEHRYEGIRGRVLAPFLGKFYGDCLESGELKLDYDKNGLTVNYYGLRFPIRIESYMNVLNYNLGRLRKKLGRDNTDFVKFLGVLYALKYIPSGEEGRERYDQISFIKNMLWDLWNSNPDIRQFVEENIEVFNGEPGKPESFDLLENLLNEQFFRLAYWKVGNEELNYRRFFTVNGLISLRIEDEKVFDTTHSCIFEMVNQKKITGLRVDHIDGLFDPLQYLNRLRDKAPDAYLTVEKILELHESLPLNWPIQGTSGYDFLNQVNGVLCQTDHEDELNRVYHQFIGGIVSCEALIDEKKRLIIGKHLAGDIDNLAHLLKHISGQYRYASDFTIYALKAALVEVLAAFPVYRTYITEEGISQSDREYIQQVIKKTKDRTPVFLNELAFIEKFLLLEFDEHLTKEDKKQWFYFVMRFQQFTGPLMAKGVEDTVLYIYNRLISLNEVGSAPGEFGVTLDDFHAFNQARSANWPHTMNATSTHDTKRGEDVRARLNVLSEIPDEWETQLEKWRDLNAAHKEFVEGHNAPDPNDEYFFYQTLLGSMPFDDSEYPEFVERVKSYIIKAIREAKVHTAWLRPDTGYEDAFTRFAEQVLDPAEENPFLQAFRPFQRKIQHFGVFNSLSQVLLKLTSPGLPDIYQGTELWDLSMVDPDNRRPIDFGLRTKMLEGLKQRAATDSLSLLQDLLKSPDDGKIKLFLVHRVLQARQTYMDLFQRGDYHKLLVSGSLQDHVVAYARTLGDRWAIAIAPRFLTSLIKEGELPLGEQVWHENRISLPQGLSHTWHNVITGEEMTLDDTLWIRDALKQFPVALLVNQPEEAEPEAEA